MARLIFYLLIAVITTNANCNCPTNGNKISFGISRLRQLVSKDSRQEIVKAQNIAISLFEEKYNVVNNTFFVKNGRGETIEVTMIHEDDKANGTILIENVVKFCNNPDVRFIFTTGLGDLSLPALSHIEDERNNCSCIIAVAGNGISSAWSRNKTKKTFSIPPVPENRYDPILPFIRYNRLSNVSVLYPDYPFYIPLCEGIDKTKQINYEFKVVSKSMVKYNSSLVLPEDITEEVHKAIDEAVNKKAEVMLLCGPEQYATVMMKYIKLKQYNFKILALTPTKPSLKKIDPELSKFWVYLDDYMPGLKYGSQDKWFDNTDHFTELLRQNYTNGSDPSPHIYRMLYTYLLAAHTIETSPTTCLEDLLFSIQRADLDIIVGRVLFDTFHSQTLTPIVTQIIDGKPYIIAPPEFAERGLEIIPNWTERFYDPNFSLEEWIIFGFSLGFIVLSVISAIAVIIYREHSIIRAAVPAFMLGVIAGGILIFISIFFDRIHGLTTFSCIGRVWFLGLGFFILFGCLFAKSYRVWKLWTSKLANPAVILSDTRLGMTIGAIISVEIILLIAYTVSVGVRNMTLERDLYRPALNEEYCFNKNAEAGVAILSLMVAYGLLLMAFGLFLAWRTKKVPFLAFNETKIILFSMYNVGFFALLGLLISVNSEKIPSRSFFILKSICVLLSAFVTVSLTVGNKFWLVFRGKQTISKDNPTKKPYNPSDGEETVPKEKYLALKEEVEKLKSEIHKATTISRI